MAVLEREVADQAIEDRTDSASSSEQPEGEEKPAPHEAALLVALRRFVQLAAKQKAPAEDTTTPRIKLRQAIVLLVVVFDLALLYLLFQEWLENPLLLLVLKVLPWLVGATALTYYSDAIRERILALCQHIVIAVLAVFFALPLLLVRQPIFSVLAGVDSDSATIVPEDPQDKLDVSQMGDGLFRITMPNLLKPYRVTVRDPATETPLNPATGHSKPFSLLLRRPQILWATVAQIPLVGRILGQRQIKLAPLYEVPTHSSKKEAHVLIKGTFEEGYLEYLKEMPSAERVCSRRDSDLIWCNIESGYDALYLPPGKYVFTVLRDNCNKQLDPREVKRGKNETIDVETICPQ